MKNLFTKSGHRILSLIVVAAIIFSGVPVTAAAQDGLAPESNIAAAPVELEPANEVGAEQETNLDDVDLPDEGYADTVDGGEQDSIHDNSQDDSFDSDDGTLDGDTSDEQSETGDNDAADDDAESGDIEQAGDESGYNTDFDARILALLQGVNADSIEDVLAASETIDLLAAEYDALSEEERAGISSECGELLRVLRQSLEHIRDIGNFDCTDENCMLHYPTGWAADGDKDVVPLTLADFGINPQGRVGMFSLPVELPTSRTYVLSDDNENNTHTGISDKDIDALLGNNNSKHPIEIRFDVDIQPVQSLYLAVKAYDVDEEAGERDEVFIGDQSVGFLSGTGSTWNTTLLKLPMDCVKQGKNYVTITVSDGWVVEIDWMQLIVDGGSRDTNLENFSLSIIDSRLSGSSIFFSVETVIQQQGNAQYYTEYMLLDENGNNLDSSFGNTSGIESQELSMPKNSPNGTYTITGLLKSAEDETIKAQDSIIFEFIDGIAYTDVRVTHNLNPSVLTNTDVEISLKAESFIPGKVENITIWYGSSDITGNPKHTAASNGSYKFDVKYTVGGQGKSVPYHVKVDNIDKTPPTITYSPVVVMEDDATLQQIEATIRAGIKVSDNVSIPADGYTLDITDVKPDTPGVYQVPITATDTASNPKAETVTVTVQAKAVRLSQSDTELSGNTFNLSAVLQNAGPDPIVESGFVWSISQYPTVDMYNGKTTSSTAVTQKGGAITANTGAVAEGLTYYSRAYVKDAGGTLYYSDQKTFSIGGKSYGVFSVAYSGSGGNFTITRTGGSDDSQTVYYRTHNGSAVAGTHYTKAESSLTFAQGETSKTVNVPILGTGSTWQNAERNFYFDIYRMTGGGTLDMASRVAQATLATTAGKVVPTEVYGSYQSASGINTGEFTVNNSNWPQSQTFSPHSAIAGDTGYYFADGNTLGVKFQMDIKEDNAGYQIVRLDNGTDSTNFFTAQIEHGGGGLANKNYKRYSYPFTSVTDSYKTTGLQGSITGANNLISGDNSAINAGKNANLRLRMTSTGSSGGNNWKYNNLAVQTKLVDTTGPYTASALFNEGYTYTSGDMLYVSLKLNEVAQLVGGNPLLRVNLTGGTGGTLDLPYLSGHLTDTLCFGVKIPDGVAATGVSINSLQNSTVIRDFANNSFGSVGSGSGSMTFQSITPIITSYTTGTLPRHSATVGAEMSSGVTLASLQYAWTDSSAMPLTGWIIASNGQKLTESLQSGTKYLHLLATANTGITGYTSRSFVFQSAAMTVTGPANNNVWTQSKAISLNSSAAADTGASVVMTKPDGTTASYVVGSHTITVDAVGAYGFVLTDNYDARLTQTVDVQRIDAISPTVSITEDDPSKTYTALNFAATGGDEGGSQLVKLEYAWANGASVPGSGWTDVPPGGALPEKTGAGTWYLHARAVDGAGNTAAAVSKGYTVIAPQTAQDMPKITLSYTPHTAWNKNPVNIGYTITKGTSDLDKIGLPEEQLTTAPVSPVTGTLPAAKNGLYTFIAIDKNGNTQTEEALINYIDAQPPRITYKMEHDAVTLIVVSANDLITPQYDSKGGITGYSGSGLASLKWKYGADGEYAAVESGGSFDASSNGDYYIKAVDTLDNETELKVTVNKADNALEIACANVVYGDEPLPQVINPGDGNVTVEYKVKNANDSTYSSTVPTELGDYTVRAASAATENYHPATVTADFSIVAKAITATTIESIDDQTYTGSAHTPTVTVTDGAKTLILDTDYTVEYSDNTNVGTATVTVTGKGNYAESDAVTFKIDPRVIDFDIDPIANRTYTGSEIKPVVTVKDGAKTLILDADYTVEYSNNTNVGTADVTVTGKGNYLGSTGSATFSITPKVMTFTIESIPEQTYTGSEIEPPVVVKDGAKTLTDADYTVSYAKNTNVGTADVTVEGKGNYAGSTADVTFTIKPKVIRFNIDYIDDETYTGSGIEPDVTVNDGATVLTDADYEVAYTDNTNVGTANVTIIGKGNYLGSNGDTTFAIIPKVIAFSVSSVSDKTYTGIQIKPVVTVKDGAKTLILDADYTVEYSNNTNVGTSTVTVTGKGNYLGSTGGANFNIIRAVLTPSIDFTNAQGKTYSATTDISGTPVISLSGAVNGEAPSATADFAFADANAGANKAVNATDITLTGTWGDKYSLSTGTLNVTSGLSITKKAISIDTVDAPSKPYDGTMSAEAGAVTFSGLVASETLTADADYSVTSEFMGNADAESGTKPYIYTVTMLDTVKANNYNLAVNVKSGMDGTISKIAYPGEKTADIQVRAERVTTDERLALPILPDGAGYDATGAVGGGVDLISGHSVSDAALTFSATNQPLGTQATITIPVIGATNYLDYVVVVTVTARNLTDTEKVDEDLDALTFDDIKKSNTAKNNITGDLKLIAKGEIHNSDISWRSGNTSFISNDGAVTRPVHGEGDKTVALIATITNGTANDSVTFMLTVKELPAPPEDMGGVWGYVAGEDGNLLPDVDIYVKTGGTDGTTVGKTKTDENGHYSFSGLPYGVYSLVAESNGVTVTRLIIVKSTSIMIQDFVMPAGNQNTHVVIVGNTPSVAADNLDEMFSDDDKEAAKTGTVEIRLVVEAVTNPADANVVVQNLGGKTLGFYLDAKLLKTITGAGASDCADDPIQPPTGTTLTIVIDVPPELQNMAPYSIVRVHNGDVATFAADYDSDLHTLTFYADKFSTYAIAYTAKNSGSLSGGGSSGGGNGFGITTIGTYWIEVPEAKTMAKTAKEQNLDYARSRRATITGIRGDALLALTGLHYQHDTVADIAVQVRIYVDDPSKAAKDILVSSYVKGDTVNKVTARFEKWFQNKVAVVSLDQQGDFGMIVQIAAKVDLNGMDTNNLYFYSYDRQANKYKNFNTEYRIDTNGYLHFATILAGDIIVSNGPLSKEAQANAPAQTLAQDPQNPNTGGDSVPPTQVDTQNPSTGGDSLFSIYTGDILKLEKADNQSAGGVLVIDLDAPVPQDALSDSLERDKVSVYVIMGITSVLLLAAMMLWAAIPRKDDPIVSVEEYRKKH